VILAGLDADPSLTSLGSRATPTHTTPLSPLHKLLPRMANPCTAPRHQTPAFYPLDNRPALPSRRGHTWSTRYTASISFLAAAAAEGRRRQTPLRISGRDLKRSIRAGRNAHRAFLMCHAAAAGPIEAMPLQVGDGKFHEFRRRRGGLTGEDLGMDFARELLHAESIEARQVY
jgi:hypothetical protein